MSERLRFVLALALTLCATGTLSADEVIVRFRDGDGLALLARSDAPRSGKILALQENARSAQADFVAVFGPHCRKMRSLWLCNALALEADADTVEKMTRFPGVLSIEADGRSALVPTRPGREVRAGAQTYGLERLRVAEAWQRFGFKGRGVRVGVIDTGCDASHPDLRGKVVAWHDFVQGKDEPYDDNGHGTHCAGTIAGGDSSGTAIGVAPEAELVIAKGLSGSGSGANSGLLAAMEWMVDPDGDPATDDGPSIVSNSWGGGPGQTTFLQAVRRWVQLGIFPSFAAGNSGPGSRTVGTPGGFLESFAVGATNKGDGLASFSSRGPVTWDGRDHVKPDVSAPGQDVLSARPGGGWKSLSGTSMACPHVSGCVALLHQASPGLSIEETRSILEGTALDLGASGKDNGFGSGRIDLVRALEELTGKGRIVGRLVSADGGIPLAGTIHVADGIETTSSPQDGRFFLGLAPGVHELRASAFGHEERLRTVRIEAGETLTVTMTLTKAETGILRGRLLSSATGLPLVGRVRVLDAPVDPVETDGEGRFLLRLPSGDYRLAAVAPGHALVQSELLHLAGGGTLTVDLALAPAPPILLLDGGGRPYQRWYREALTALDRDFAVRSLEDGPFPGGDELLAHELVILYGAMRDDVLDDEARDALEAFVNGGGKLFLTGQNLLRPCATPWTERVLGIALAKDGVWSRKIEGEGLRASIAGGDGADDQDSPDGLEVRGQGGRVLFSYGLWSGTAAVFSRRAVGRVVTAGFGFEALSTATERKAVMEKVLSLLGPR